MLNHYETVFIMTPVLSDDQMKETVNKFEKFLTDKGAEIIHQENWGLKRLAYPIAKKTSGFYHLIEFKAPPNTIWVLSCSLLAIMLSRLLKIDTLDIITWNVFLNV